MKMEKQQEEEMKMLLDGIPYATSPHPHHHQGQADARASGAEHSRHPSPVHDIYGDGLQGHHHAHEGSSSGYSSLSGNISPAGDEPFRHSPELGGRRLPALRMMDELGLLLRDMHVQNEREAVIRRTAAAAAPFGNNPINRYVFGIPYGGVAIRSPVDEEYGSFRRSVLPNSPLFNERSSSGLGPQQHCCVGSNLLDSPAMTRRSDALLSYPNNICANPGTFPYEDDVLGSLQLSANGCLGRNSYGEGIRGQDLVSPIHQPSIAQAYLHPQQNGGDRNSGLLNTRSPLHGSLPKLHCGLAVINGPAGTLPNSLNPHSLSLSRNVRDIEAFDWEDSFIIQGKGLHCVGSNGHDLQSERKRWQLNDRSHTGHSPRPHCSPCLPLKYDNLMDIEGYIYYMAKDQHGCRFLQRKFDEREPKEIDVVFRAIIDHVAELMVNPFGNYLMQKLLDVCSEEQRTRILLVLTKHPAELVRISLNTHGTRAVQKLIETLKTRQQIALVISALKPGFLDLIKDLNGNHVVQRCLQSLSTEDNKFIFYAAAKNCVDIATHRHGCCVLQRCIAHSTGEYRTNLVAEISFNGLLLAQDAFGNYVVQYILDLENSSATANFVSQFKGNYVQLSMQKFSSNVVEKCLKVFREEDRARIIVELLSVTRFEQLLQDPYANYVIQSALENTKGSLHAALEEAIRPHAAVLRANPYCKRIFSRAMLKK